MAIRIVRLGSDRAVDEGIRIGTVRRPPRGVPKERFSLDHWYDVWFPILAPNQETMKLGQSAASEADWVLFAKQFRTELGRSEPSQALNLLAALSHTTNFSIGCYCESEARCHRSILRELLVQRRALIL